MISLLIGLNAALHLPVRQYPKLSNTVITGTTTYPGASPELMQGFITTPIEQAVASAEGIDYMTSQSVQGTSTISVYMKLNADPNQALTDVMAKVNQVKYEIPKAANDPIIVKSTGQTTAVMYICFSSNELSDAILSDITLRPEIKKPLAAIDRALMFLHEHKAITLQGGLAIMRQAMIIRLEDGDRARRYTMGDFKPLAVHYREKRFQVHVMMEYAQLALDKIARALCSPTQSLPPG